MQRSQDFELTQFEHPPEDKDQLLLREELQLGNTIQYCTYIIVVNFNHMSSLSI
jgi:hypothetical protein